MEYWHDSLSLLDRDLSGETKHSKAEVEEETEQVGDGRWELVKDDSVARYR